MVGDYALATGGDCHVGFVASLLGCTSRSIEWASLIPASRVQLAAALHEAWQRQHPVACFGGLGDGADDHTRATIDALHRGRDEMGLSRHVVQSGATAMQVGNVAFFSGDPARAHILFAKWWQSLIATHGTEPDWRANEQIRWALPESPAAVQARQQTKIKYPTVSQRLIASPDGDVALRLSGASKGKVQAARKALQAALKHL